VHIERGTVPLVSRNGAANAKGGSGMATTRRRSVLIDQKVQGAIIQRCALYWLYCLLTVTVMLFGWSIYHRPPRSLGELALELIVDYGPPLAFSLLLLPIVLIDVVRFSQSFVGPVHRVRCSMHRLAQGERVEPIAFRQDDFWADLADSFNMLVKEDKSASSRQCDCATDMHGSSRDHACPLEESAV
jgi:hypothetical protein